MTQQAWRSRIVDHGEEAPDQLLANPRNWRVHPKAQQEALAGVLDRVGWVQDVIVNRKTGHVVDGHLRVALALSRQEAAIPVVYVELDAEEEALMLVSLDPLSAMAVTDGEALEALRAEVVTEGALAEYLDGLMPKDPKEGLTDPDAVPAEPEVPYVQRGEVYQLGEHRLMCGDATADVDVATLMEGASAELIVTDPPYGVGVVKAGMVGADFGVARKGRYSPIIGDTKPPDVRFVLAQAPKVIVWGGNYFADQLPPSGSWLVWDKRAGTGIRNTFADCELAWSNLGGPARIHRQLWNGMIREGEHEPRVHPTQKPVALLEWCIGEATGGTVLDPYVGSGTTIVAAERTGRRCYAMEIEPKYVQVSIERWEQFTGQKAEPDG